MQTSLLPVPNQQFLDANGDPLSGGKLYFYEPGTATPKSVYGNSDGTTTLTNPVILDSTGRANVWLNGYYKIILKNSVDTTIYTVDNISSQYSDQLTNYQFILQNDVLTYISATQFSVPDDRTVEYAVGRRIRAVVTAGTIYGTITASSSGGTPVITTVTCLWDSGSLDSGLSAISTGVLSIVDGALPIPAVTTKTGNYSMTVADVNKIFQANSANAIAFTLLGASAVPSGAGHVFKNVGAGNLELTGTVNGISNATLLQNEDARLWSDGTLWHAERLSTPFSPIVPIGGVVWWHKALSGVPSTLPWGWVECNGQTLSDAESPLNGQVIPDINGDGRFIRANATSGTEQANQNLEHSHSANTSAPSITGAPGVDVHQDGNQAENVYGKRIDGDGSDFANAGGTETRKFVLISATANAGTLALAENPITTIANTGSAEARPVNISMVAIMRTK